MMEFRGGSAGNFIDMNYPNFLETSEHMSYANSYLVLPTRDSFEQERHQHHIPLLIPQALQSTRVSLSSGLTFLFRVLLSQNVLKQETNHLLVVYTAPGNRMINCPILLSKVAQIKDLQQEQMQLSLQYTKCSLLLHSYNIFIHSCHKQ